MRLRHLLCRRARSRTLGSIAAVILLILPTILAGISKAQENQSKIVSAMQQIADNWKAAIEDQAVLLCNGGVSDSCCCGSGPAPWCAEKLSQNTIVSFDVKKTDSLVTPYLGILTLNGVVEGNYVCTPTPDEALANTNFTPKFDPHEMIAFYNFDGHRFKLSSGNEFFENAVLPSLTVPSAHNSEVLSKFNLLGAEIK
jgi:hypothetical protein